MAFESKKCTSFFCARYCLMTAMWQQKEFYLHGCISFSSVSLKITFFWHSIMRMDYGNIFLSWIVEDKSYTVNDFLKSVFNIIVLIIEICYLETFYILIKKSNFKIVLYWTNIFSIKVWSPYEFGSQITNLGSSYLNYGKIF